MASKTTTSLTHSDVRESLKVAKAATPKVNKTKTLVQAGEAPMDSVRETLQAKRSTKAPAKKTVTVKSSDGPVLMTAAQVARDNGLDGRRFRSFLRAMDMDRRFATKAQAAKAVKAFQKAIAEKSNS